MINHVRKVTQSQYMRWCKTHIIFCNYVCKNNSWVWFQNLRWDAADCCGY